MVNYTQSSSDPKIIILNGHTFQFRDQIKSLGGKWDSKTKMWSLNNTPENIVIIKKMKAPRTCGFCGKKGHIKTKCDDYILYHKDQLQKASLLTINSSTTRYKWLEKHGAPEGTCSCKLVSNSHGYKDFYVDEPDICWKCIDFCCSNARLTKKSISDSSYSHPWACSYHGTCAEQYLNDTRGT